jgi:methylase of polypeptide subunit release factors
MRFRLKGKKVSRIDGFSVVTDRVNYKNRDQVFPIQPEHQFFLDDIVEEKIKGAKVLEVGLGSGVLSIAVALRGARKVIGLEINPRAKAFAAFNILSNGVENAVEIRDGEDDIYKPVRGEKFDYIISNPPFEPVPPSVDYYLHSAGGIYGLDFVEKLLVRLDFHLKERGHAQIVTMGPGNEREPFMLSQLAERYLTKGKVEIKLDLCPIKFGDFVERFVGIFGAEKEKTDRMEEMAAEEGISHFHLCMLHYQRGLPGQLEIIPSKKVYERWNQPIGSDEQ